MSAGLNAHLSPPEFPPRRTGPPKGPIRQKLEALGVGKSCRFPESMSRGHLHNSILKTTTECNRGFVVRQHPISRERIVWRLR